MSNPWGGPQPFDPNQPTNPPSDLSDQPAYAYPSSPDPAYPGAAGPFPPPYQPPLPPPYPGMYPVARPEQPQAVTSMVLGILGLVCCGLASPFALWLGRKSLNEIDASGGWLGGRGQAQAGFIMGIIGTAMWALALLSYIAIFAFGIAATWTPGGVPGN